MEAYITDLRDELEEAKQDEAAMLYKKEELLKEQRNIDVMQTAVDYVNEINASTGSSMSEFYTPEQIQEFYQKANLEVLLKPYQTMPLNA